MTPEVQFFLQLAARRRLATTQDLSSLVRHAPADIGLTGLLQEVVDHGIENDFAVLQELAEEARTRARSHAELPGRAPGAERMPLAATNLGAAYYFPGLGDIRPLSSEDAASVLTTVLSVARREGVSDVHITAGHLPTWRRWGILREIGENPLDAATALTLNLALLPEEMAARVGEGHDATGAIVLPDGTRCRANVVAHHLGTAGSYHLVPDHVPSLGELGFANADTIERLLDFHNGLILVSGPAGSGKTTTLAALVQVLARNRTGHVVTIEDPVEILHAKGNCGVSQREVGRHTATYATALRSALREDPDIIVVGEMHDLETMALALTAAETGHLVLASMHTIDAASALNRILSVFPPNQTPQVRAMVSESLRGIVYQQLLPAPDGRQVLASELLVNTPAVSHLIREGRTYHLEPTMQTGLAEGMQTMDRCILSLVRHGRLSADVARGVLRSRQALDDLAAMVEASRAPAPRPAAAKARRYLTPEEQGAPSQPSDSATTES